MMSLAAFDVESTAMFLNESALSAFGVELGDARLFLDRLVVLVKAAGIVGQRRILRPDNRRRRRHFYERVCYY